MTGDVFLIFEDTLAWRLRQLLSVLHRRPDNGKSHAGKAPPAR